jgi:hypothetical protein
MTQRIDPPAPKSRNRELVAAALAGVAVVIVAVIVLQLLGGSPEPQSNATTLPETSPSASVGPSLSPSPSALSSPTPSPTPTAPPTPPPTPTPTPRPTPRPTPTPTPATEPEIVSFDAPETVVCGSAAVVDVHLTWHVERADGVTISIDGPGAFDSYPPTGEADLPFACGETQHTYLLTTTGGTGPADTLERVITRAP